MQKSVSPDPDTDAEVSERDDEEEDVGDEENILKPLQSGVDIRALDRIVSHSVHFISLTIIIFCLYFL